MSTDQSSDLCGAVHPEKDDTYCCKARPCFGEHWSVRGNTYWNGRPLSDKAKPINSIVDRIKNKRSQ